MMNSEMFMQWVEGRLMPTFDALYGPGTTLGGAAGKKMTVIMVCIHKALDSFVVSSFSHGVGGSCSGENQGQPDHGAKGL